MSLARRFGALESDDSDECDHPSACDETPVARVPRPAEITANGIELCPFHLALWADTRGDQETLERLDVDDLAADDRFLELDAAPPRIHGGELERIGVDHRGLAHYYRPDDGRLYIYTFDAQLVASDVYHLPEWIELDGWISHVDRRRSWIELDDELDAAPERDRHD